MRFWAATHFSRAKIFAASAARTLRNLCGVGEAALPALHLRTRPSLGQSRPVHERGGRRLGWWDAIRSSPPSLFAVFTVRILDEGKGIVAKTGLLMGIRVSGFRSLQARRSERQRTQGEGRYGLWPPCAATPFTPERQRGCSKSPHRSEVDRSFSLFMIQDSDSGPEFMRGISGLRDEK